MVMVLRATISARGNGESQMTSRAGVIEWSVVTGPSTVDGH